MKLITPSEALGCRYRRETRVYTGDTHNDEINPQTTAIMVHICEKKI